MHFRLVVNGVMATDISDKEMKALRDGRWNKAFGGKHDDSSVKDSVDRKATIVIEHLIQASDVVSDYFQSTTSSRSTDCIVIFRRRIPCSIGISIGLGTSAFSVKCTAPIEWDARTRTLGNSGTRARSASSTSTSSRWQRNLNSVECLECPARSTLCLRRKTARWYVVALSMSFSASNIFSTTVG